MSIEIHIDDNIYEWQSKCHLRTMKKKLHGTLGSSLQDVERYMKLGHVDRTRVFQVLQV